MGIKGTVCRSIDGDLIHANVDIDLIITEEPEMGNVEKPVEIFHIIEHFCLGRRRLHLFGRDSTIRPGELDSLFPCCVCDDCVLYSACLSRPMLFSSLSRLADRGSYFDQQ